MRLMASGIEVQKPHGRFVRFIENDPRRPKEYEEFRRIAAHLQWLNDHRQLFVRSLVFDETLIADFRNIHAQRISTTASTWDCDGDRNRTAIMN
jgi:hypothetical protein